MNQTTLQDNPYDPAPSRGSAAPAAGGRPSSTVLESLIVLVIGVVLMSYIHAAGSDRPAEARGLPGHDSFYHVKMAALIPEHGLLDELPWLKFVYFTDEGHDFVSHHYGFHVFLTPFVQLSHWLTGDYLAGGRWAVTVTFGLTLMLFNLLLIHGQVRWRWLWLILFILMPAQFFTRHAYIRAISPSLVFMLLLLVLMFRRRFLLTGLAVALFTHLYLGGVLYAPVLVGLFVLSSVLVSPGAREVPWRLILAATAGWAIGVVVHPYAGGMAEFLRLQVFGTGLSPDIPVGREWKPYEGVWWFVQSAGVVLVTWVIAVTARLRLGKPLSATDLTLLLLNFAFLVLTCKARRFIEYWPVFCLLSAAYLFVPVADAVSSWWHREYVADRTPRRAWFEVVVALLVVGGVAALIQRVRRLPDLASFADEWPVWLILVGLYALVSLCGIRRRCDADAPPVRIGEAGRQDACVTRRRDGGAVLVDVARTVTVAAIVLAVVIGSAAYPWSQIQRGVRCGYDLPAIRAAMEFVKGDSAPAEVIFTDDWDIFPVFFYYNSYNHYIVGLDPKFTHARRPDLWKRYVKISRGQVPADESVEIIDEAGSTFTESLHIALTDIRDYFGARYVITDQDHKNLARKLANAREFAELVYPSNSYTESRDAPYLVFRIRG